MPALPWNQISDHALGRARAAPAVRKLESRQERPFRSARSFTAETVVLSALKIIAILLIVAGIAGLVYGKFTYTKKTHEAQLGPIDLSVKEKETVNIPLWAGIAAIAAGLLLFVVPKRT